MAQARLTSKGKADFADYLIGAVARQSNCQEIVSFDRKLKTENWFRVLD